MTKIKMNMITERQKKALENLELLELLRIRKKYFPTRYEKSVYELGEQYAKFIVMNNVVYLSYSGNCGTEHDKRTFKTGFEALEYALISSLNGRKTETTYACDDRNCFICSSFYDVV